MLNVSSGLGSLLLLLAAVCFAIGWWFSMLGRSRQDDPVSLLKLQQGWRIVGRIGVWCGCALLAAGVVVVIVSLVA